MEHLQPIDPRRLLSRPEPSMSESARRLHELKSWLATCTRGGHWADTRGGDSKRYDEEAFTTECRLREQAAHIIGFMA